MKKTDLNEYLQAELPTDKQQLTVDVVASLEDAGYEVVEVNIEKP